MAWIYLIVAGIFEMGWPLGFKLSQVTEQKLLWILVGVISMAASGYFLWVAQKEIPIGTAYAVWTHRSSRNIYNRANLFQRPCKSSENVICKFNYHRSNRVKIFSIAEKIMKYINKALCLLFAKSLVSTYIIYYRYWSSPFLLR
jgi:hypothetical protein